MKKYLWYAIIIAFMVSSVSAQTDDKKEENKLELNNTNNKNSKTTSTYWTLANKADLYYDAGNVGIGTSRPNSKLDVSGTISATGLVLPGGSTGDVLKYSSFGTAYWDAPNTGTTSPWVSENNGISYNSGASANVGIGKASFSGIRLDVDGKIRTNAEYTFDAANDGLISFGSSIVGRKLMILSNYREGLKSNINGISITSIGNVGIGTNNPDTKLVVAGKTKTESLQITSGVCNTNYVLSASDANGNAIWKSIETVTGPDLWEESNGNICSTSGNVGIGTNNPDTKLVVAGKTKTESLQITSGVCNTNYVLSASDANGNAIWKDINGFMGESIWSENSSGNVYFEDGYVGIGTNNPQAPLDIDFGPQTIGLGFVGNSYSSSSTYSDFQMETSYETGKPELTFKTGACQTRYNWACQGVDKMTLDMVCYNDPSATKLTLHDGTIITKRLKVTSTTDVSGYVLTADADGDATWQEPQFKDINGNLFFNGKIGIGTESLGTHKLAVNGSINAKEILVTETVPSSDYVFEEDYPLMPLTELENFVNTEKHLPEVMSAKEFAENGYNLGEMDDVLLRKVEELTLYIIQQQKDIAQQQREINSLKDKLENQ